MSQDSLHPSAQGSGSVEIATGMTAHIQPEDSVRWHRAAVVCGWGGGVCSIHGPGGKNNKRAVKARMGCSCVAVPGYGGTGRLAGLIASLRSMGSGEHCNRRENICKDKSRPVVGTQQRLPLVSQPSKSPAINIRASAKNSSPTTCGRSSPSLNAIGARTDIWGRSPTCAEWRKRTHIQRCGCTLVAVAGRLCPGKNIWDSRGYGIRSIPGNFNNETSQSPVAGENGPGLSAKTTGGGPALPPTYGPSRPAAVPTNPHLGTVQPLCEPGGVDNGPTGY